MSRVKRGTIAIKRRRNVLAQVKGYRFGRSKKERQAREAIVHAGAHAFAHRKDKKADRRRLWQVKINATLREMNMSYSKFMGAMKKKGILLDRKVLADLAENHPTIFAKIVKSVS
ncbi:MAG TPA: 50S ribosomal protein L20 [Candidatus Paceibacterota bacterium]